MTKQQDWDNVEPVTGGELARKVLPERMPWLSPLIVPGFLGLIFAKSGIGKSYFCLWMAGAVAGGHEFLKWHSERRANVLYVDGEMGQHEIQDRYLHMQAATASESMDRRITFLTPDMYKHNFVPCINKKWGQDYYEGLILKYEIDVFIFDNLGCLTQPGPNESDERVWMQVQAWLTTLRMMGKCVVVVHHAGKSGDQLGTSRKEHPLNWSLKLSKPFDYEDDQGARFDVTYEKGRGKDKEGFTAWYRTVNGNTEWLWKGAKDSLRERVRQMKALKMKDFDIARELEISIFDVKKIDQQNSGGLTEEPDHIRVETGNDYDNDLF